MFSLGSAGSSPAPGTTSPYDSWQNHRSYKPHGQGLYEWPSGEKYIGEWSEGQKHGLGTHTFSSGEKYEGHFTDGKKNGHGTYLWLTGVIYVGEFKGDKRHGRGYYTQANGPKIETFFVNGESLSGSCAQTGLIAGTAEYDQCILAIVESRE